MTLPTFVAVGAPSGGTGAVTPGLPAGWAADDCHALVTNTKRAEAQVSVTGYTFYAAAIPTGDNKVSVFLRNAQSGDAAPTVPDSGDHTYAVIIGFRNPNGGTCTVDASFAAAVVNAASTAVSWPDLTTPGADRMVLQVLADGLDATGARFSGQTNANLSNLAERFDNGITSNGGGGLVIVTGEKATAGAIGNTAGTLTSATQALLTISIEAAGSGSQAITGALFTDSQAFYGATVAPGTVIITGALVSDADAFYGAMVSASYAVSATLVADSDTFYAAAVTASNAIAGLLFTDPDTFFAATITADGATQTITGELFANDNAFFGATIAPEAPAIPNRGGFWGGRVTKRFRDEQREQLKEALRREAETTELLGDAYDRANGVAKVAFEAVGVPVPASIPDSIVAVARRAPDHITTALVNDLLRAIATYQRQQLEEEEAMVLLLVA